MRLKSDNPFLPGSPRPRHFAGREMQLDEFRHNLLGKWEHGNNAAPLIFYGLPGVGKSALLNRLADIALEREWLVGTRQKLDEDTDLRVAVAQVVGEIEASFSLSSKASRSRKAALTSFREMRISLGFGPLQVRTTWARQKHAAGSLGQDLTQLLLELGRLVSPARVLLVFDELQALGRDNLRALMYALDETMSKQLSVTIVAAGLPQAVAYCRSAGRYAERFNYQPIAELTLAETIDAFRLTAQKAGDDFSEEAAKLGYELSDGYPQFIQVYGETAWAQTDPAHSPLGVEDLRKILPVAEERLRNGFFMSRIEEATPPEQELLFALARLPNGPQRATDIAREMGKDITAVAEYFRSLIDRGLLHQTRSRGPYAFTVPKFGDFLSQLEQENL